MKKLLVVQSSPNGDLSFSRKVSENLIAKIVEKNKGEVTVRTRDLHLNPVPHLTAATIQAMYTPAENHTPELSQAIELSNILADEFLWADEVILSVPMWNFGVPSVMKAWIDHVSRVGKTFSYGPEGLKGLAKVNKAYLVIASGSVFSEGPYIAYDLLTPYLKTFFGFLGVGDVSVIRVEGVADPAKKDTAIANAISQIDSLLK